MDNREKETAKEIRAAIKQGNLEAVTALIGDDAERLNLDTPFGSWLHVASAHGKVEIVRWLIAMGAEINSRGGIASSDPLHQAASAGHLAVVECLLECGSRLDVSEPDKNPLFGAIYGGHTDVARTLVENGVDTSIKYSGESMHDMDALAFARELGRHEIVELLLRG